MQTFCTMALKGVGMNEASFVGAAGSRETGTLDALYRAHADKLLGTLRRITRNHEDAEDAVQDAFLSVFLHLHGFNGRSTFSTWLTRIGINSALMILRKKRNSHEVSVRSDGEPDTAWEVPDSAPDPEKRYAQEEQARLLREAIAGLRPSIRRALEIHTLQGRSIEEMASEIGISVCAEKARLFHARAALPRSRALRSMTGSRSRR